MSDFKIRLGQTEIDLLQFAEQKPILPYAGTSGWSGSETSLERAVTEDTNGTTSAKQKRALDLIRQHASYGLTWKELSELTGWHHGSASGVLSVLHKAGLIARLSGRLNTRQRCAIYVAPQYVNERATATPKVKRCRHCGGIQ